MWKRSMIIARKEIRESFRSGMIKYSFIMITIMFGLILPLLMGFVGLLIGSSPISQINGFPFPIPADFFPQLSFAQRSGIYFVSLIIPVFLFFIPVMSPLYLAADSFAGEKERKTIQQLLSVPLTDSEILLGKILTSFIPAVIATYFATFSATAIINIIWWYSQGYFMIVFPSLITLIELIVLCPLFAFFGILTMVFTSSRARKAMEAAQLGGIAIIPVFLVALILIILPALAGLTYVILIVAIFAIADYSLFKLASRRFTREAILSRM